MKSLQRIALVLVTTLLLAYPAQAQDFVDLIELDYRTSHSPEALDSTEQLIAIHDFNLGLLYPRVIDSSLTQIARLNYGLSHIAEHRMHSLALMYGFDWQLCHDWRFLFLIIPKLSGDLQKLEEESLQLGGFALFKKTQSEKLVWKLGSYMNMDLFGPLIVPLLGARWQISPKLKLDCTLPVSLHLRHDMGDNWISGIKYSGRKYSYNISQADAYMEVSDNHVWAYIDAPIAGNWVVELRAGHSVLRSYAIYDAMDKVAGSIGAVNFEDERPTPAYELLNGPSVQLGLRYRFHIEP